MAREATEMFNTWIRTLPRSRMVYPDSFRDRLKYAFWRVYTPCHPLVRDSLVSAGIIRHTGRHDFLIGTLSPGESIPSFIKFLISHGYGNHFVAWRDQGEIASLRLVKDFVYQYHIRIFADGEVRGHYEYTPECYPLKHLKAIGQEDRRDEFLALFGDRVIPV